MVPSRQAIYLTAFAVVAVYFLVWPLWRAQFPLEIWPTESWSAYFDVAAAHGRPIYPSPDLLIANNYPPLSFYVIGTLARLLACDPIALGRVLSVVALGAIGIEIALAATLLGAGRAWGAVGGLWFVAIMAHVSTSYVGASDPQLAGQAIMGAGLVWFIARDRAGRSCFGPLLLMVAAGFWKHNIVAIPLTAVAWLTLRGGARSYRAILVSGVAALAGLALCRAVFGPEFLANLLEPRAYGLSFIVPHLGHLQWLAAAAVVWLSWVVGAGRDDAARFTALHVGISLTACIVQWSGDGVAQNAEFDPMIALGIGIGVALGRCGETALARRLGVGGTRDLAALVLLVRLVASERQEPALVMFSPTFRAEFVASAAVAGAEAARAAAVAGDLFCDNKTICWMAGKRFAVDEFKVEQMVATGAATPQQIDDLLRSRGITRFTCDPRAAAYNTTQLATKAARGR
ncbi:MAG: hypothetical protein P4M07_25395 [Xanthobacteraceae bacterium]|nr:hypothetical protein [Xanthobacteraceae bacterium]